MIPTKRTQPPPPGSDKRMSGESSDNESDQSGDSKPTQEPPIDDDQEIKCLRLQLKAEVSKHLRAALSSKSAAKKLKTVATTKANISARRLTDAIQKYEAEHFTLSLRDKEIKSLKAMAKKNAKENKDEMTKILKDHQSVLTTRAKSTKALTKQIMDTAKSLEQEKKKAKQTAGLLSGARLSFIEAQRERDESKQAAKTSIVALKAANKKIDCQLETKLSHARELVKLKCSNELAKQHKQQATKDAAVQKTQDAFTMKAQLMKYQASLRSDEKRKEAVRKEKKCHGNIDAQKRRMEMARTAMSNTVNGNGGAFPNPARASIHDVSFLFVCVNHFTN